MADHVRFTETMSGTISAGGALPHLEAAFAGRSTGTPLLFTLTVITPDVDAMVLDPDHRSPAFGVVLAPALHAAPLTVLHGHLDLFADAAPEGRVLHMRYGLQVAAPDGARWFLRGLKVVARRSWWPTVAVDTTTLFIDVWPGDTPQGTASWRGVLTMGPGGVLMQGLSFRGQGGWLGIRGIVRYLGYYARRVWRVYTGPQTPTPEIGA